LRWLWCDASRERLWLWQFLCTDVRHQPRLCQPEFGAAGHVSGSILQWLRGPSSPHGDIRGSATAHSCSRNASPTVDGNSTGLRCGTPDEFPGHDERESAAGILTHLWCASDVDLSLQSPLLSVASGVDAPGADARPSGRGREQPGHAGSCQ